MTSVDLLAELRARGIEVRVDGGNLRVSAPSGGVTETLRAEIAARKQELLALLQGEVPLPRLPRDGPLPLSHFQERLWLLQRLDPGATDYNLVTVWPMGAEVDADALERSVRAVAARTEILRLSFRIVGDTPQAMLLPMAAVPIVQEDFSGLAPEEQFDRVRAAIDCEASTPFDLATAPPVRFVVYGLGEAGSALLVAAHHIAMDHWSLSLLRREIREALTDPGYADAAPPLQYADYAGWSRSSGNVARRAEDLDWWERYLASPPELSAFDADRVPELRGTGGSVPFNWDEDFSGALSRLAQREQASVYMCLVAACASVLHAHTGAQDILIGSAVGARGRPEFERIIGPFVNTVTMRLAVEPGLSFRTLLARAREAVLETDARGEAPFEMVMERVKPSRNLNRSPLFQTAVVMQNAEGGQQEVIHGGGAVHDLTWFVRPLDGRFVGAIEYRSDIYLERTIERILGRLEALLRGAVADPDRRLDDISLLVAGERERLLAAFNPAPVAFDATVLPVQIAQVAARSRQRPALRFQGETLSYCELDARANRVARRLQDLGIGAGAVVGLCLERGPAMIEGLVGIQRAGAAYLPLDPDFPAERLRYQLEDSGAKAVLADAAAAADLGLPEGVVLLDIEAERDALAALPATDPGTPPAPDDFSHVIYTSGSTGRPKGMAIRHRSVANVFASLRSEPGMGPEDIVAATTTVAFDIAAVELLLPLTVGAVIELLPRSVATDGRALDKALAECGATVVQATPSAWRMLIEAGWQGGRQVRAISGGEPLARDLADQLLERTGALWNGYGPSETTIYSSGCRIEPGSEAISIGRPVANTRIYVLDERGEPAPTGMRGEICIAGAGVAAGYLGLPAETEARFLPDRLIPGAGCSSADGPMLYRTGDLGRWSPDGRLYHLGRSDHQVKIRGLRIELGEIEAVLLGETCIRQAVVVVRDAGGGDHRIVAYVVFEPGEELTVSEVRRLMRSRLPTYMVPSIVVDLMQLPMTPNGKIDRKALPDPFGRAMQNSQQVPPAPGLESDLARIWSDVLRVERIGAEDNFFELGGHSLLTLRVVARVEEMLGLQLDPRLMFFQNLRQIAGQLARQASLEPTAP